MPMMVKLEDRIVLDGAALFAVVEEFATDVAEQLDAIGEFANEQYAALVTADDATQRKPVDVLLVSDALDDHQALTASAAPGTLVLVYDAANTSAQAVLSQVAAIANSHGGLQSLSIMSHGDDAQLRLGNEVVDSAALQNDAAAWSALSTQFTATAVVNLFACDLAKTSAGESLVEQIASLTGTTVNASDDITGADGDWNLEFKAQAQAAAHTAAVASAVDALDLAALSDYQYSLAATVENNNTLAANEALGTVITTSHLLTTATNNAGDQESPDRVEYTITSIPQHGVIRVDGRAVSLNETFTQTDIDEGRVSYEHNGSEPTATDGSDQDMFSFLVSGPQDNETSGQFSITISQTNDAPLLDMDTQDSGRGSALAIVDGDHGAFTEGGVRVFLAQTDADGVSIIDVDDTHLASAQVVITNLLDMGNELLAVDTTGTNISSSYDATTGVLTLSGVDTIEQYEQVLATLTYENTSDDPDDDRRFIQTTVNDGESSSNISRSQADIIPVNDVPVLDLNGTANNAPVEVTFTEDGPAVQVMPFSDLEVSDPDNTSIASAEIAITNLLDSPNELLAVDTSGTDIVASYDATTGVLSLSGPDTPNNFEAVLRTLTYSNGSDGADPTDRLLAVTINDGELDSVAQHAMVHIELINDAPVWTVPDEQEVAEDTTQLIPGLSIADPDAADEPIEVTLGVNNGSLTFGSTTGVTFISGTANGESNLVVRGTLADLNAALATLNYQGDTNFVGDDQLQLTVNDLGNTGAPPNTQLTDSETVALMVTAVDDAPQVDLDGAGLTDTFDVNFTEEAGAIDIFTTPATISDVDSTQLSRLVIQIDNLQDAGDETLTADTAGTGLASNYDDTTGVLTITGVADIADYEQVLNSLQYNNAADEPNPAARTISVVATDTSGTSADPVTGTVNIVLVNDAPVWTVPDEQRAQEDTPHAMPNISIADDDVGDGDVEVTLAVSNGTLTLGETDGLSFSNGDADADASMTFTGTLDDVNTALATLSYQGDLNYNGTDTLQLSVSDLGNTPDSALTDTATVGIVIDPVNDAPVVDLDGAGNADTFAATYVEDGPAVTVLAETPDIVDVDGDAITQAQVVITNPQDGADEILAVDTTGTDILAQYDPATHTLTLTGEDTAENYEAVLATLTYVDGAANPDTTQRVVAVTVTDENDQASSVTTGTIDITPVNDAPVLTAPSELAVAEDTAAVLSGISIADIDAGTGELSVTLTVGSGTLNLGETTGLTFVQGDGVDDTQVQFTGTLDDINAALATISYQGNENFNGSDTLQLLVDDQGNTPDTPLTDSASIALTINAENDTPVLDVDGSGNTDSFEVTYTEQDDPIALTTNALDITDIDSTQLSGATVQITNVVNAGQEQLLVDTTGTPITSQYDANTGTLSLQGAATIAEYEQVLATLQYQNTSDNPTDADRQVTIVVSDDQGATSATSTGIIHVVPVNDAPTAQPAGLVTATALGSTPLTDALVASDPDHGPAGISYTLTELPEYGVVTLNGVALAQGDTFTQQDVNEGRVGYTNTDDSEINDQFSYEITDGDGQQLVDQQLVLQIIDGFITDVDNNSFDGNPTPPDNNVVVGISELEPLGWQPGSLLPTSGLSGSTTDLEYLNAQYAGLLDVSAGAGWSAGFGGFVQMGGLQQVALSDQSMLSACSMLDSLQLGCRFADTSDLNARLDVASPQSIDRYADSTDLELLPLGPAELLGLSGELLMDSTDCDSFNQAAGILAQAYNGDVSSQVDTCVDVTQLETDVVPATPAPSSAAAIAHEDALAYFEPTAKFTETEVAASPVPTSVHIVDGASVIGREQALGFTVVGPADVTGEFQPSTEFATVSGHVENALSIDDLIDIANTGLEVE